MPKKNAARGEQRNKPRTQKHFELVRSAQEESQPKASDDPETIAASVATSEAEESVSSPAREQETSNDVVVIAQPTGASRRARARSGRSAPALAMPKEEVAVSAPEVVEESESDSASKVLPQGSAAARIAARRQAAQKNQQRAAVTLITPEHYAYVRHDLMIIAILAIIMFATIIILHFVPGIGY